MKFSFVIALAAILALASASCKFEPNKRKCAWNVELTYKTDAGVQTVWKYWINGRFLAKEVKNGQGDVTYHAVFRPDVDNNTYVFEDGTCKQNNVALVDDWVYVKALSVPSEWDRCEQTQYNGKDVTKYSSLLGATVLYADKNNEPIAFSILGETFEIDFGSKAWMSDFSFGSKEKGCTDADNLYKSGNDDYAFCAAGTVKAALAVVLAAIAAALVALF